MFSLTNMYYQPINQLPSVSAAEDLSQWNNQSFVYRDSTDSVPASFSTNFAQYPGQQQVPIYNNLVQQSDLPFVLQQQQQQALHISNSNNMQQHRSSLQLNDIQFLNVHQNNDVAGGLLPMMNSSLTNINYNNCSSIGSLNQINMTPNNVINNRDSVSVPVNYNTNYQQLQNNNKVITGAFFTQQSFNNQQLGTADINSSQSAPTSPAQSSTEAPIRQQWPPTRHYSTSPDTLDIPNIVLTGADGTLDCFQDLQDLHLDNEIQQLLNNPNRNEQFDPALETQLFN